MNSVACRAAVCCVLLLCLPAALAAAVEAEDFVLSSRGGVRSVVPATRSRDGQIYSAPRLAPPAGTSSHHVAFEFESDDYFGPGNKGHFAIGLRADGVSDADGDGRRDLQGGGIVIGNVTEYPQRGACGPTRRPNTIVIEGFWAGGNCIHPRSEGPELRNGERYRVAITYRVDPRSTPAREIMYTISLRTPKGWKRLAAHSASDDANPAPASLGGWFFVEVFSTHDWTLRVYNFRQWWTSSLRRRQSRIPQ